MGLSRWKPPTASRPAAWNTNMCFVKFCLFDAALRTGAGFLYMDCDAVVCRPLGPLLRALARERRSLKTDENSARLFAVGSFRLRKKMFVAENNGNFNDGVMLLDMTDDDHHDNNALVWLRERLELRLRYFCSEVGFDPRWSAADES